MIDRIPDTTESVTSPELPAQKLELHEWALEVTSGPEKGRKVQTLEPLLRVGSDPANDLVLSDPTVSRRHCEFELTARGLVVRDLGSRNGTTLDGRPVLQAYLRPNDKLLVGKTKLVIRQEAKPTVVALTGADSFGELVGASDRMRALFAELRRIAQEDITVLVEGETGTGKELAARGIHAHSARREGPFRVVDCNLITEEAAERELFGGPREQADGARGAFEAAAGGTLFFDEVGELPLSLQPKLLRVLESREIPPLGGEEPRAVDVRIIASTNKNLEEEVRQNRFRADLYYRLAVARVRLPSLRTRREDLPVLAHHLLGALGSRLELTPQTLGLFEGYDWPGNVRELRNVLERGALMAETGNGSWLDFMAQAPAGAGAEHKPQRPVSALVLGMPYHEAKDRVLADFERLYFAEMMREAGFDMGLAEQRTGLSMQSLYRLLKKNGLRLKDLKNAEELEK